MASNRKLEQTEEIVYTIIWVLVFLVPVISVVQQANAGLIPSFMWSLVFPTWRDFLPYFILFFVYDELLSRFLANRRRTVFLVSVVVSVALFYVWIWALKTRHYADETMLGDAVMPASESLGEFLLEAPKLINVFIALVMLVINTAMKLYIKGLNDEATMRELEREKLERELTYLKYQISPHFFMNTLNNIHALMDLDTHEAQASLLRLSKMMRYVLYDSNHHIVSLDKEVEFLVNYIELMRLRYNDSVLISTHFPTPVPDVHIPPMLLVSYIENAFKHGIRYNEASFLNVSLQVKEGRVEFHCINSTHPKPTLNHEQGRGIGLTNTEKRLKLLFGEQYSCTIKKQNNIFDLLLKFPMQ